MVAVSNREEVTNSEEVSKTEAVSNREEVFTVIGRKFKKQAVSYREGV